MASALMTTVSLEGRDVGEAQKILNDQVIPNVKGLPGFQRGVWVRSADGAKGIAIVVFDSEDDAKSAQAGMDSMRPADAPPITSSEICEVSGLA